MITGILFVTTVLLTHLHYSIDVFGGLFITFSIHHLATSIFKRDLERFEYDPERYSKQS